MEVAQVLWALTGRVVDRTLKGIDGIMDGCACGIYKATMNKSKPCYAKRKTLLFKFKFYELFSSSFYY